MGWDGESKVSFKFLHTLWVYRTCIGLLIYMFKNCHQLCYGFENLMSSWRVWISFSKLLWGNVFLKNHAKSKVFQNNGRPQAFFVKIWCQVGKLGYNSHRRTQSFRSFDQALTSPSGVQRRIYTASAEHEFISNFKRASIMRNGECNGERNGEWVSKLCFFFLYTFWVYTKCICLLTCILKKCHQHCYGF